MNRRQFLASGAALSAAKANFWQGSSKRVGLIGSGWYGKADLLRLIQIAPVEVVSICDVDRQMVDKAAEIVSTRQLSKKKPRTYHDYREMLKQRDLDLVLVATPDHWHALAMIEAVKSGCDVYCQKPISTDVVEGQAMVAAARKYSRVVQVGTQRRSTPHLIEARDNIIKSGKLGKIGHVEVFCYYGGRSPNSPPDEAPPEYLDWDFWTGPAPMLPYNRMAHPRGWRNFMEYGNGIIGDMCIHMFDMVRWMLDLGWPMKVSATGGILVSTNKKINIPDTQSATFDYGNLQVTWQMRTYGTPPDPKYTWGANIYGEKGTLKAGVFSYDFIPVGKNNGEAIHKDVTYEFEQYPEDRTEQDLERHVAPAIRGHMKDLLSAMEKRSKPVADIEQGHISTASCILGNVAMKVGRTLYFDPATHTVKGDAEATRLLRRPYRAPWVHPEPDKV